MNTKTKRTILFSIGAFLMLTIVGAVSYAFFATSGEITKQEATISTATVSARFADGNTGITKELNFGETLTKTFTIENTGSAEAHVKMYFKDLVNTYTEGSLTYTLSQSETETGTYIEVVSKTNVPSTAASAKLSEVISIPVGKTYYYSLVITLNYLADVNQDADLGAKFSSSFDLKDVNYKEETGGAAKSLLTKANDVSITDYTTGNQQEMYAFDHDITSTDSNSNSYTASQIENWTTEERRDYRYIGNNPNNYITFNDETWRIIGVFTIETEEGSKEQLIKIIRDESIGDLVWDSSDVNEWSASSLKTLLNDAYYNRTETTDRLCHDESYESITCDYTVKGLNETAREQVENVKWYLGGSSTYFGLGGPNYYSFERGTTTCVTTGNCSGETRNTKVVAKVGLMYPSDYVYTYANGVDDTCYIDGFNCDTGTPSAGWLFNRALQWTISPNASSSDGALNVSYTGNVNNGNYVHNPFGVRPSVYLRSDIEIKSGTGASNDPYLIG